MNIKLFEDFDNIIYPYEDDYLKIHKIKNGNNKGKIQFRIEENKYSMTLGCAKIINTKYENNTQIRNIELGPIRFRKVANNTKDQVFIEFLIDMGYELDVNRSELQRLLKDLSEQFSVELYKVTENVNTLGDVIDNLKSIRQKVFDYLKDFFENWQLQKDTKQYNL